jgi:small subunit ribosomal protein S6
MNYYEIPFAVLSEIPSQGIETLLSKLKDILGRHNGKIIKAEYWGNRDLAYSIRKHAKGRFYMIIVEAESAFPADMVKYFKLNESILRYAIYKIEKVWEGESYILRQSPALKQKDNYVSEDEKSYMNVFAGATKSANHVSAPASNE